jgi:hypothetical protein
VGEVEFNLLGVIGEEVDGDPGGEGGRERERDGIKVLGDERPSELDGGTTP